MGQKVVSFKTLPLAASVELTKRMDRLCFPKEMWLSEQDLCQLIINGAESTVVLLDDTEIGQAITLPEPAVMHILQDVDPFFSPSFRGVYSYSESILPEYQNCGYGVRLLQELTRRMHNKGYKFISAHVRTRYGWNRKRMQALNVTEARSMQDFWDDPMEIVEYQKINI